MIYFIEYAGLIKVGFASNIDNRIKAFRTTMPTLSLLGSMEGSRGHERTIHDALALHRTKGEWFKDVPEVREFLKCAMAEGVEEWKSNQNRGYRPSMWDERAKRLCEIICSGNPKSEFKQIELEHSIPARTIWHLRYRMYREVSVGEFFALLVCARETIKRQRSDLDRSEAFVADLEREDADKTNALIEAEDGLRAAQALFDEAD